jgi:hypothetical protein
MLPAIDLVQQPLQVDHATRSGGGDNEFHSLPFTVPRSQFPVGFADLLAHVLSTSFGVFASGLNQRKTANREPQTVNSFKGNPLWPDVGSGR